MSCLLIAMILAGFGSAGWTVPEASIAAVVPVAVAVESGRAADAAPVRGLVDASPQNGGAPAGEPSHPPSGDGFAPTPVRIQVVDLSGAKVQGALVELFPPELAALPEGMSPRDLLAAHLRGQLVRAADADRVLVAGRTAADGACVLTIPRAHVRLVATTAAASSGWIDVDTLAAARLPELQVCLTPLCRVQGRVLDRDGAPREGVTVELSSVGGSASFRPCEPVLARTDADGRFALTCGPAQWRAGVRELATETHRFAALPGGFVEVTLRELGTTSVQVALRGAAAESDDVHVWARLDGDAGQVFAGRCVEPTRWVVALPGAGSYTLHAGVEGVAVAAPVAALLGPNDRLVPVTVTLAPLQAIRGVVVAADGQPLSGALLMCCEDLGAAGVTRCRGGAARDDGTFEFDGLDPSRRYRISCRASAASDVFAVRRAVAPGSRLRLVDAPSERADVSLEVVDAATGRPLALAGVRVLSERGGQFKLHAQTYDGDEQGVVVVPNVAVGDEVAVAVEVEGFAPSTLAVTCGVGTVATRVPMARPGNVAIEVLNADGTPAVAADVSLTSRLPATWRFAFGWLPGARRTSGDGRQQWDGLAPGTYDVHADGGPRRGTAVGEVEVRAGAAARVTLRLPRE